MLGCTIASCQDKPAPEPPKKEEDPAIITEAERIKAYANECKIDIDAKMDRLSNFRAYIDKLEMQVKAYQTKEMLEKKVKEAAK